MNGVRVTHLDHCTVLITDVRKARHFYGELLGLREIPAPNEFNFAALWYDLGGQYLHLLLKSAPDAISPRHFCLHVHDAAKCRIELLTKGLTIEETTKIAAADRFFIHDPDGNRIELLQWLRPYDPPADGAYRV